MKQPSDKTFFLLKLAFLRGVGPATLKKVASLPSFEKLSLDDLAEAVPQIRRSLVPEDVWGKVAEQVDEQVLSAKLAGANILSAADAEYPQLLARTPDDPFILFVKGEFAPEPECSVAVIGTREPTPHGEQIASRVTAYFAEQRWSIVSGLAFGCDAVAHRTALKCNAHTVAVLAHGLHTIAPARHKELAAEILDNGGALVTEYRFGQDVQKQQYVKRDRIQAGMSRGVVMVQSDTVGGSLHATRAALEYGRWIAVPYPTERDREHQEPKVQGNLLIAEGSDDERCRLLKCSQSSLDRIIVLQGKEDYLRMTAEGVEPNSRQAPKAMDFHAGDELVGARIDSRVDENQSPLDRVFADDRSAEVIRARGKIALSKVTELDVMLQCLTDPTTGIAPIEARIELESALIQMRSYALAVRGGMDDNQSLSDAAKELLKDLGELEMAIGLRSDARFSSSLKVDASKTRQSYIRLAMAFKKFVTRVNGAFQAA